jgi:uncharacterized protein with FMN-binding domain
MRRAPIVLASTVAGLGLVVAYNPHQARTVVASAAASGGAATSASTPPTTSGATESSSTPAPSASTSSTTVASSAAGSAAPGGTATGSAEQISEGGRPYGEIQVKATVKDGKVTAVTIVELSPADGRSSSIDDFAVPQLVRETIDAGSAKIDAVSGATYTSQAYEASLQAALDKLV